MIKVCHITSVHNSEDVRIFHKECSSLAKAGYDVYLVAPGDSREENGVHIVGIGECRGNRIKRMTIYAQKAYKTAIDLQCDVYHLHDPELLIYCSKLKQHGGKIVFDSHEDYQKQIAGKKYIPQFFRNMIVKSYKKIWKKSLNSLSAVIIPCDFENVDFGEHTPVIVGNHPILNAVFLENKFDKKDYYYACVTGALTYNRAITYTIRAAAQADIELVLAGAFSPSSYQAELEADPSYGHVDYRGYLPHDEVIDIICGASVGISCGLSVGQYNTYNVLATKTYEYMAAGIPVILSESTYHREQIEKYHFGICVPPDDVDAISNALLYLKNNPPIARKMGENGRKAVVEEFNWTGQETALLKLYREMCK